MINSRNLIYTNILDLTDNFAKRFLASRPYFNSSFCLNSFSSSATLDHYEITRYDFQLELV